MNTLPYPRVSKASPILTVTVSGMDLADIVSVGETALYLRRIGEPTEFVKYFPFEEKRAQFLFAFDEILFDRPGGRYMGRMVYKGVTIAEIEFIYDAVPVTITGSTDV